MSKNLGSVKKESPSTSTSPKERIIPIKIEVDEEDPATNVTTQISTRSQSKKKDMKEVRATIIHKKDDISVASPSNATTPSNSALQDVSMDEQKSVPERPIPPINIPERIIIILDRSLDDNFTHFESSSGKKFNPLSMLQHAVQMFVHNKNAINPEHEFALMVLNDNSATWLHDFTSTPLDIITTLSGIKQCIPEDIFNMNAVFDVINKKVVLPKIEGIATPYVVRAVLLYDRSYSIPVLKETPEIVALLSSPLFTFDVVMTHEPPSAANHCIKIFEALQKIDIKGFSYSFSVSRNSKDLHIAMGKILGHSLQRPLPSMINPDMKQFKM